MNKVVLIGNWTKDCELRFTTGGTAVLSGTLAVQRRVKKDEEQQADFIPVVIWGKQAESTGNYCGLKGNKIGIVGRIQTRNYDNKEGKKVYITEVVAEEVEFLNAKKGAEASGPSIPEDYFGGVVEDTGEDIPF